MGLRDGFAFSNNHTFVHKFKQIVVNSHEMEERIEELELSYPKASLNEIINGGSTTFCFSYTVKNVIVQIFCRFSL